MDKFENKECQRALDPHNIAAAFTEQVRLCRKFKKLLGIEQNQIKLATVVHKLLQKVDLPQQLIIPTKHVNHFIPHQVINKINWLDVIVHHVRLVYPRHKMMLKNQNNTKFEIKLLDYTPEEIPAIPNLPEEDLDVGQMCKVCLRYYDRENLEAHINEGPFAKNHMCHTTNSNILDLLLAQVVFKVDGRWAKCRFCESQFSKFMAAWLTTRLTGMLLKKDISLIFT